MAYFVALASLWPTRPGLYMDETIPVEAALGGYFPHQSFVYQRLDDVPVLIMPYIGTLKSALFAPIFAIAGVSALTIRLPVIALSAMTLVVAYLMGREFLGRWSAVFVLVMATCPTFIFMTKVDWGPTVLAMFLTTTILLAFFRYLRSGGIGWLWVIFASALLGIFDKQNFLWFVVGFTAAAAVVYRRTLWDAARQRLRATLIVFGVFVATLLLLGLTIVLPNLSSNGSSSLQDPVTHLAFAWGLYQRTMGYSEVIGFLTGRTVVQPVWMDLLWVCALALLLLLAIRRLHGPLPQPALVPARAAIFFLIVAAVMFVEVAATKQATGPQHVIELMPYPVLVLLCSLVGILRAGTTMRVPASVLAGVAVLVALGAQGFSAAQYVSLMQNPSRLRPVLSLAVYSDASFLNANASQVNSIVAGGWGPDMPLFSLACAADRSEYRDDLWPSLVGLTPTSPPSTVRSNSGDKPLFLVSVSDPSRSGLPSNLRSNPTLIAKDYSEAFPGRHPQVVLTTSAYNITYLGPGGFRQRHAELLNRPGSGPLTRS